MAIMIPSKCLDFVPASKEDKIFDALSKLPDNYYVLYSTHLYDTIHQYHKRDGKERFYPAGMEHEIDFLILVPDEKIIVLEAKAAEDIEYRVSEHAWYQNGELMEHNGPFNQASENRHWLTQAIQCALGKQISEKFNAYSLSAVWFVGMDQGKLKTLKLPPEVGSRQQVLTMEALEDPKKYLDRICPAEAGPFRSKCPPLNKIEIERLINDFFAPPLHIKPSKNYLRDSKEGTLLKLTKSQEDILYFLEEQPFAVISGLAGTGKTFVAMKKAEMEAAKGEQVLFLCFNSLLAEELQRKNQSPNIRISTIASFACTYCHRSTAAYDLLANVIGRDIKRFPYKHIIVDEAQDFGRDDLEGAGFERQGSVASDESGMLEIFKFVTEENGGSYYLFYDKEQLVNNPNAPSILTDPDCKLTLYKNCRNTKAIAEASLKSLNNSKIKAKMAPAGIAGSRPMVVFPELGSEKKVIDSLLLEMGKEYEKVVILTPNRQKSALSSYAAEDRYFSNGRMYPFYSCRRFKGLEADAVLLIDINKACFDENDRNFYVGASRAKFDLKIVFSSNDGECREILKGFGKAKVPPGANLRALVASELACSYASKI